MGILTHRCTKGERCKRTKRINLLLETKIYSSSSVAALFRSGKCSVTVTIHLLVIRKKPRILYKSNQKLPQLKASFIYLWGNTTRSPNAEAHSTLQHLTTLHKTTTRQAHQGSRCPPNPKGTQLGTAGPLWLLAPWQHSPPAAS